MGAMGGQAAGGDAGGAGAAGGNNDLANLGFDPNMDPELAAAIRMSLEEQKAAENAN